MTKIVVRNPALLGNSFECQDAKMKNKVNRMMKILQKRIQALPLTPILQEITMKQILTMAMKTIDENTDSNEEDGITMMVITTR